MFRSDRNFRQDGAVHHLSSQGNGGTTGAAWASGSSRPLARDDPKSEIEQEQRVVGSLNTAIDLEVQVYRTRFV
jgi:hypothetical protein